MGDMDRLSTSILASTPLAIIAAGIDGLITVFNPGAERLLGYSAEEILGKQSPVLFFDTEELRIRAAELSSEFDVVVDTAFDERLPRQKPEPVMMRVNGPLSARTARTARFCLKPHRCQINMAALTAGLVSPPTLPSVHWPPQKSSS